MAMFMVLFALCAVLGIATWFDRKLAIPIDRNKVATPRISDLYLIVCMVPLFLICALRAVEVGVDTDNYVAMFWNPEILEEKIEGSTKYEIGYVLFVKFLRLFSDEALLYLVATSAVVFVGIYLFIRNNCRGNYAIGLMVYVAFLYFADFSAIRQTMAISIAINCVPYLRKKRWIPAALIILLGAMFHMVALCMLILIPFAITPWTKKKVVIAAALSVAGTLLVEPLINLVVTIFPIYQRYLESEMMQGSGGVGIFALLVGTLSLFAAVMLFLDKIKFKKQRQRDEFILALIGSIFTIAINLVGRKYGIVSRVTRYFIPFVMILAADVYKYCIPADYSFLKKLPVSVKSDFLMKYHITPKALFYLGVALLMGIYFYTIMDINLYEIIPYQFYFK